MKSKDSIAVIVQARLGSQRVPKKMTRPFAGTTLFDIVLNKLINSNNIPIENIFASINETELINIASKYNVNIFNRSVESAKAETDLQLIYEWHDKLDPKYEYVVLVSGCNPLLSIHQIDKFYLNFLESNKSNLFATTLKKTYFWDKDGNMIWDRYVASPIMNTKLVQPLYEAAHCLYASRLSTIKNNNFMVDLTKEKLNLTVIPELEAFDIDYEWQFKTAELLYEKI